MIDVYCERTGPGLFAEPVNALTNFSFIIAAWAIWVLASRVGRPSTGVQVLVLLSVLVGVGSILWHTFATNWALWLDIIPILLFLICFFWLYMHTVAELPTSLALAVIGAFLVATYFLQGYPDVLNGALAYTPGLIVLLALGVLHAQQQAEDRYALLAAAGVHAAALVFRTIDDAVCPAFSLGTHFLWHSLNGVAVYLATRTLLLNRGSQLRLAGSA